MNYLFVPSSAKGDGIGHLLRAFELANDIRRHPSGHTAEILLENKVDLHRVPYAGSRPVLHRITDPWDLIILDKRATAKKELAYYSSFGMVIGLDEGGPFRNHFPFLIDTLPVLDNVSLPNDFSTGYLSQPLIKRSEFPASFKRILISFGGEDPAHLTEKIMEIIRGPDFSQVEDITLVYGPRFGARRLYPGVRIVFHPPDLRERLHEYDLVITSFGRTAFEAAAAGVGVILYNPSSYHQDLARKAGFPEIGLGVPAKNLLKKYLHEPEQIAEAVGKVLPDRQLSLSQRITQLDVPEHHGCPLCKRHLNPAVERFYERTFLRCETCRINYQILLIGCKKEYKKEYFFAEYKKQYGKTYLEDFAHIQKKAAKRVDIIRKIAPRARTLLDVGCAYGPFLKAAGNAGLEVYGVDPSEDAVAYVNSKLSIPAVACGFEYFTAHHLLPTGKVDIITFWYVIEHFPALQPVFLKINELLNPGGLLAFSTPNGSGISRRYKRRNFFKANPIDHFTIWDPKSAIEILDTWGFDVGYIHTTGHHPERFPFINQKTPKIINQAVSGVSRMAGLGDTFEVYALQKVKKDKKGM